MSSFAPLSFKVRTTLAAYRIVAADTAGSDYVIYPSASTVRPIGVTQDTVKDTISTIPVIVAGIAKVLFNDTMSTGGVVCADSAGRGVLAVAATTGVFIIGSLIGPNVAQTGTVATVLVQPGVIYDVP